jgi:hypothetical protein
MQVFSGLAQEARVASEIESGAQAVLLLMALRSDSSKLAVSYHDYLLQSKLPA